MQYKPSSILKILYVYFLIMYISTFCIPYYNSHGSLHLEKKTFQKWLLERFVNTS